MTVTETGGVWPAAAPVARSVSESEPLVLEPPPAHGGPGVTPFQYVALAPVPDDGEPSDELALFPAWPCADWRVDFVLHAPKRTVISGSYDGAGNLTNFSVVPPSRQKDVVFAGCVKRVSYRPK